MLFRVQPHPQPFHAQCESLRLAGAGAGVVRALEIQQKNAGIRAQTAKELEYLQKVSNVFSRTTDNYKQRAKALAEEIEGISKKMVSEDSSVSCFEKLEYTYTRVSVTDLGSCIVKVNVKIKTRYDFSYLIFVYF